MRVPEHIERSLKAYDPDLYLDWDWRVHEGGAWTVKRETASRPQIVTVLVDAEFIEGRLVQTRIPLDMSILERIALCDLKRVDPIAQIDRRMEARRLRKKAHVAKWLDMIREAADMTASIYKQHLGTFVRAARGLGPNFGTKYFFGSPDSALSTVRSARLA